MQPLDLATIPGVLAIVEMIKKFGLPSDYAPIAALVIGVLLNILVKQSFGVDALVQGLLLGLSASGLWSGGKTLGAKLAGKV